MRIFLNYRKSENIENDTQLSKFNYGLRKYYSIKTILLEKRPIYNFSMRNNYLTIHNMIDLEACYNRQLPIVLGLIQESVRVNRKAIKVILNIIPRFKHFIYTHFRIYKEKYGGDNEQLVGNSQGNIFIGVSCRD